MQIGRSQNPEMTPYMEEWMEHKDGFSQWQDRIEPMCVVNKVMTCRGQQYEKDCGDCVKARGIRRSHKKKAMVHTWNLSADLSGPHPKSVGTDFSYLLV